MVIPRILSQEQREVVSSRIWDSAHSPHGSKQPPLPLSFQSDMIAVWKLLEEDQVVLLLLSHAYLIVFPTKIV